MKLREENVIVIVGDLGAGANFVKNTILLSPSVDFPGLVGNRVDYISKLAYPNVLKQDRTKWTSFEYTLRFWKQHYGVDIADEYSNINTSKLVNVTQTSKVVLLCHWPDTAMKLKKSYPNIKLVSLFPNNDAELQWQIETYISKIGIHRLQNFTFLNDIEQQKNNYINTHGTDAYFKLNVLNMFEIMKLRAKDYRDLPGYNLSIGTLQHNNWVEELANWLNIDIDLEQSNRLFDVWHSLHTNATQHHWLENNDKQN